MACGDYERARQLPDPRPLYRDIAPALGLIPANSSSLAALGKLFGPPQVRPALPGSPRPRDAQVHVAAVSGARTSGTEVGLAGAPC